MTDLYNQARATVETRSDTMETRGHKETGDKTVKHEQVYTMYIMCNPLIYEQFVGTTSAAASGSSNSDTNIGVCAFKNNRRDLKNLLSNSEPIFRDIASACTEKELIHPHEHAAIFDKMTNQSSRQRADEFIDCILSVLEICPDQLDVFLRILKENGSGSIAFVTVAERIAQSKKEKENQIHQPLTEKEKVWFTEEVTLYDYNVTDLLYIQVRATRSDQEAGNNSKFEQVNNSNVTCELAYIFLIVEAVTGY